MTILVTGATGNIGRQVVEQLLAAGESVRALTRDPSAARLPAEAEVVAGDMNDPDAVRGACEGIDGLFLLALLAFDSPIVSVAAAAGVKRIVTATTDAIDEGIDMGGYRAVELGVEESGLEWTHVRPGEFMANKRDFWARSIREEGVVRSAYPDVVGSPVHEADVAAVAVAALTTDGHQGKVYRLSGGHISHRQQVAAISEAIGRPIAVRHVTHSRERAEMIELGAPAWAADHVLSYFVRWVDEPSVVTSDVERVTGAPPRGFDVWARDHVADFR